MLDPIEERLPGIYSDRQNRLFFRGRVISSEHIDGQVVIEIGKPAVESARRAELMQRLSLSIPIESNEVSPKMNHYNFIEPIEVKVSPKGSYFFIDKAITTEELAKAGLTEIAEQEEALVFVRPAFIRSLGCQRLDFYFMYNNVYFQKQINAIAEKNNMRVRRKKLSYI